MKTTVFDLIWKLKRELEKHGHNKIDLHRFTHEQDYRQAILLNVDISELHFSKALEEIYKDLLQNERLDLAKEVEVPDQPSEKILTSPEVKPASNTTAYLAFALIVLLVSGFGYMLFDDSADDPTIADVKPMVIKKSSERPSLSGNTSALVTEKSIEELSPAKSVEDQTITEKIVAQIPEVLKPEPQKPLFRLYGSNTIGEVLAPELIKAFYKSEGASQISIEKTDVEVENNIKLKLAGDDAESMIPIHAHGSSTGFKALDQNQTDLAMASRRIKDKELKQLGPKYGNLRSKSTEHIIGMDGLAVIVNPSNPIDNLSTEQLAKLFSGNAVNWKEFGGQDAPVKVFARDTNSGTWDSFKSMVLKKHGVKLVENAVRIESSVELSDQVSKTPGAIGFIGLPYVLRSKALAISDDRNGNPIYPTTFTISTEDYPLVRRLYIYEPSTIDTDSQAHKFITFVLSEAGQQVVKEAGFISQNIYKTKPMMTASLPQNYLAAIANADRLSLNFRFHSGTFQLDNKAERDLQRVVDFFEKNPGQQAMLIGFSDSIGDPAANASLSLQRAKAVERALLARGINIQTTLGMGEAAPIASNQTRIGRERNRRVEIWVNSNTTSGYNAAIR
ncbi:substrate-binding domain-containing protein [Neptuniibacter caesariensis]|uniref:OmpA family protein n=1 Tax=Neptuniibacter caesariensis TaxID=207954 RepID=A0A7U8C5Z8_NEPCE|nr:phosphate ABC transporter substrate-binding/OmpA family protein [Neptuniibacter caesariensis]EAR62147.1 ompA family protein [Oceanospirillum sp. MED92] [Neptuniibacter caesariensis]